MYRLERTNSENLDFIGLVRKLDKYLAITDGEEHNFYAQYNKLDLIKHVVIAYDGELAVGCGAIKEYDSKSMEVKRMFVEPAHRGTGIAGNILDELENWASELGYQNCVLETGKRQVEAVKFYNKRGYKLIDNYGQYVGMENSVCYIKRVK